MTPKPRREHPAVTLTIQEAVTETVQRSYGPDGSHIPPKAIAQDMNVALSVLYDIADEHRPRQLRAAELPALVRASGNALVLRVVTRAVGGVFVPLPDATSDEAVYQAMSLVVKELGDDSSLLRRCLANGIMTADEAARFNDEVDETVVALLQWKAAGRTRARMDASEPSSAFRAVGGTAS